MLLNQNSNIPIYRQVANIIKDQIIEKELKPHMQVPSTNDLSKRLSINPATARKGLSLLRDKKILYKKRGIGMFVCEDAWEIITQERKAAFEKKYIKKMLAEADKLNISTEEIINIIHRRRESTDE